MTHTELTFWHNDDGSLSLARLDNGLVLGKYRDDDPDGWRAWLGNSDADMRFLGLFDEDDDALEAIAEAARAAGIIE